MQVTFRGSSDDTFMAEWKGGDVDHDDCANFSLRVMHVKAGGQEMLVTGIYGQGDTGTWAIGIAPADEDHKFPDWPMAWSFEGYSAVLNLTLPEGFEITLIQPVPDEDDE